MTQLYCSLPCAQKTPYPPEMLAHHARCCTIGNSQQMEWAQMSVHWSVGKEMWYGITALLSSTEEWNCDVCKKVDGTGKYSTQCGNPVPETQTLSVPSIQILRSVLSWRGCLMRLGSKKRTRWGRRDNKDRTDGESMCDMKEEKMEVEAGDKERKR